MTVRQREVYMLIVESGLDDLSISEQLGMAYSTEKMHVRALRNELGVDSRLQMAVQYWRKREETE